MDGMTAHRAKAAFLFGLTTSVLVAIACAAASGQSSRSATKSTRPSSLDSGNIKDGVYHNPSFGFSYKIPFGWVDRTEVMRQGDAQADPAQSAKAQVLLAVFERPPEAPRREVNSGVVIAIESASSYPGLKAAVDYFGPLEEVTTSKGFKVVNEPYDFAVGEKSVPREDFSKEAGDKDAGEMTMHQTCLVLLQKGYILSLTFISDSDDNMDELLAGLSFHPPPLPAHKHATPPKK